MNGRDQVARSGVGLDHTFPILDLSLRRGKLSTMTLLMRMESERQEQCELLRHATRRQLLEILRELQPADKVIVFGSLTRAGRFSETSDVDFALEAEPKAMSLYQLTSVVAERLGRRVDVVNLAETRLANKIRREGETWMLQD